MLPTEVNVEGLAPMGLDRGAECGIGKLFIFVGRLDVFLHFVLLFKVAINAL